MPDDVGGVAWCGAFVVACWSGGAVGWPMLRLYYLHVRSCLDCVRYLRLQFHWRRYFDATIRDQETYRFAVGLLLLPTMTSRRSSLTRK